MHDAIDLTKIDARLYDKRVSGTSQVCGVVDGTVVFVAVVGVFVGCRALRQTGKWDICVVVTCSGGVCCYFCCCC